MFGLSRILKTLKRVAPDTINYRLAEHHFPINMSVFELNRKRLVEKFRLDNPGVNDGMIFLEGGKDFQTHATDKHSFFRQESFFYWATGVQKE